MINQNIPSELKHYIESEILPQYSNYDKAHRIDHINKVIEQSEELAKHYDVDTSMVYVIAAYHDLGICEGREFHHISSGRMLTEDKNMNRWFDKEQIGIMKEAIEDHRASSKDAPRTIYGRIVAEADRSIEYKTIIRRTIQYGLKNYPELDMEHNYERLVKHMHDKYYYGGYLKLWLPESNNAAKLEELRTIIADENKLKSVFKEIYHQETNSK